MKFTRYVTRSYDVIQTVILSDSEVEEMLDDIGDVNFNDFFDQPEIWDYLLEHFYQEIDEDVNDVTEDNGYDYKVEE